LTTTTGLRIGEVARLAGTTTRTIRYYEELGLLASDAPREAGRHRLYGERDVERLREVLRLKQLLGVNLEELKSLIEAEEARAALRDEWHTDPPPHRRREILEQALGHVDRQLALADRRRTEIERLHAELEERRASIRARLAETA